QANIDVVVVQEHGQIGSGDGRLVQRQVADGPRRRPADETVGIVKRLDQNTQRRRRIVAQIFQEFDRTPPYLHVAATVFDDRSYRRPAVDDHAIKVLG